MENVQLNQLVLSQQLEKHVFLVLMDLVFGFLELVIHTQLVQV